MAVSSKTTTGVQVSSPAGTSAQSLITDSSGTTNRVTLLCHFTTTGTAIYLYKNNVSAIPIFQSPYSYIGIPLKVQLQANISDAGVFTASTYNFTNLRIRQLENYLAPGAQFSAQTADSVYYSANNEDCVSFLDLFLQKDGSECRTNFYSFPGKDSLDIGPVNGLGTALSQVLGYDDFNPLSGVVRSTIQTAKPILYYRLNDATVNLLTANQASLETNTTGWSAGGNTTIARSTAQALVGAASLSLTSIAAGGMSALTPTPGIKVAQGQTYSALASFRAATTSRSCYARIVWYQADGVSTSAVRVSDYSTRVADTTTGWLQAQVYAIPPSDAVYGEVRVEIDIPAAGAEVHYVDRIQFAMDNYTGYFAPTTTVADSSGGGNTGTIVGGVEETVPYYATPPVSGGGATLFDGVSGHIVSNSALAANTGSASFEAWVYHTAAWSATHEMVIQSGTSSNFLDVYNGKVYLALNLSVPCYGATALSLNTWHHIAGTWDGTTMSVYLDGVLDGSVVPTGTLAMTAVVANIGWSGSGLYFNGELAEVAVYNYALSAVTIAQHALGLGPYTTPGGISTIAEQGVFLNAPPFRLEEGYNLSEAPVHNASAQPHANEVVYMGSGNTDAQAFADVYSVNEVGNPLAPTNTTFPRKYPYFELLTNDDRSGLISVTRGLAQSQLELSTDINPEPHSESTHRDPVQR